MVRSPRRRLAAMIAAAAIVFLCGCTGLRDYVRNGFKVGPDYCTPEAPVAQRWIDDGDKRVRSTSDVPTQWWSLFNDKTLNDLIEYAASQNLSLREAGYRILEARAQLGIATGNFFPQSQTVGGDYARVVKPGFTLSTDGFPPLPPPYQFPPKIPFGASFGELWDLGFNLDWELDFWGRFRRAIASAEDTLEASVADYDDVLVTLFADVATNYVQVRTQQKRIELVRANVELQRGILKIAQRRYEAGAKNELDVAQASSNLDQTESQIPQSQLALRQACNRLCVLLGIPPLDLEKRLGTGPIPAAPEEVVVGIPADLLRRRPDVRRAERLAAAQGEEIGIAQAALYPAFGISGSIGWQADKASKLFRSDSLLGSVGPSFKWEILNYGRIVNNVRLQRAEFQRLVTAYQNTVLKANSEAENGLTRFLYAQEVARLLDRSVLNSQKAANIVARQYKERDVDFNRIALIEQTLVQQQDLQAQAHGEIAQGLIQLYRSLGGGWETPLPQRSPEDLPEAASVASETHEAPVPVAPERR